MKYKIMKREDGDILGCDSCGSEVPLYTFDAGPPYNDKDFPSGKRNLCRICAETHIGCKTRYGTSRPEQFAEMEMYRIIAQVGNVIIQELKESTDEK